MNTPSPFSKVLTASALILGASQSHAAESSPWSLDVTLYGLAAGMTGDVGIGPIDADLDVDFGDIWDNLEFGAMGKVRVGYEKWSLNTDVIYMGLGASKDLANADLDQWVVEPTLGYRLFRWLEVLAGVRYNNISGEIVGYGSLPVTHSRSRTEDWWDPIVGANLRLPFAKSFFFDFRGDVGGFGIGSDVTAQAFPSVGWQISKSFSVQAGYRLVYTDYETGSGADRFKYDVLTHGPQLGATFSY